MNEWDFEQLQEYVEESKQIGSEAEVRRWSLRVAQFLRMTSGESIADSFTSIGSGNLIQNAFDQLAEKCGYLEGLVAIDIAGTNIQEPISTLHQHKSRPVLIQASNKRVFVVHGHDGETKEAVARFLEKLELEPIILHEQPNQGQTIIEKFEGSSGDVSFAVVLLTPDDLGRAASAVSDLPRARQNVILELGYFLGRLGRTRVCALHRGGIEFPSDYQGVVYVELDNSGGWKSKLAQELVEAKLPINVQGLLQG